MTAGFSSLYYTDCLPGQGLRGGAGFQFQAVSEGVGHEEMTLVQRTSLYEAPVAWMREQRAVADYPPSLTHVFDGRYATARGIYLGAEANGVREGNQFTHAVITDDPDAYGQVRPAQLWDAPWWVEKPVSGTRCDPVSAEPEHGPWGCDAVREWVLGKPDALAWLTAVFSALDRVGGVGAKRIAFVASDASEVLGWLAAGTLLLPQSRALRVSFRVFAANPQYSRHDVIAVHPDWAGIYADVRRDHEFLVFNLVTGERSEVEPTDAARHWAPRLLRHDPYDVVDAVEWADQWARARGEQENAADRIASCVVTLGEPVGDAAATEAVARWLTGQPEESIEDHRAELVDAVLAGARTAVAMRSLDVAAHRLGVPDEQRARVRLALLGAEVRGLGREPAEERRLALPPAPCDETQVREMTETVERAADDVRPELMDPLLRLASRFGLRPRTGAFLDGAHRFLTWWADHPAEPIDPRAWPNTEDVLHQFRDVLLARLQRHPTTAGEVRERWWRLLWPMIADPATPLDRALAAAAVERGDPRIRAEVIDRVLGLSRHDETVWRALFEHARPRNPELVQVLERLDHVSEQVAAAMFTAVERSGPFGREQADVLALLEKRGRTPGSGRLRVAAERDAKLRTWLDKPSARTASTLNGVGSAALGVRADGVLHALLEKLPATDAVRVIEKSGPALSVLLCRELPARLTYRSANTARAAALTYVAAGVAPAEHSSALEKHLRHWVQNSDQETRRAVAEQLRDAGRGYGEDWSAFAVKALETAKPAKSSRWPFGRRGEE